MTLRKKLSIAAVITLAYLFFAGLWIAISDWLVALLVTEHAFLVRVQAWKGSAFVLVSALILYIALRLSLSSRQETDDTATFDLRANLLVFVYILMTILITGAGYLSYRKHAEEFIAQQFSGQTSIAKLKAIQIENWLAERRQDIKLIQTHPKLFSSDSIGLVQPKNSAVSMLKSHLNTLLETKEWVGATLYTPEGAILFQVGEAIDESAALKQAISDSTEYQRLLINDIHHRKSGLNQYRIEFLAPVTIINEHRETPAVLAMSVDPAIQLYKIVREWPALTASSEALLIRRDGDEVVYLSKPSFSDAAPLELRNSLEDSRLSATRAILDETGSCECIDYRNTEVLSAFQPVSDMPWYILVETDSDEILHPLRLRAKLILLIVMFAVGAGGLAVLLLWRGQQMRFALFRQRQWQERAALVGHYDRLVKLARDIFLLIDANGRIVEANEAATSAYGYCLDELYEMNISDLYPPHLRATLSEGWQAAGHPDGTLFQTFHQRKDGSIFQVEISCNTLEIDNNSYRQSFIRDISSRLAAEVQIRRLNKTYAILSETNQAIMRTRDPDELFRRLCRIAVEFGGYLGAWIGRVDEATGRIQPVASDGAIDDYIRQAENSIDPASPKGQGPTATAIREDWPCYCDDFLNTSSTKPWHDLAKRYGIGSSVALPLHCGKRLVAVFSLYAAETHIFDQQMRALLEEMTQDISFALTNFEREVAREQAENRLKVLFKTIPDYVWLKDGSGIYLACNPAFEQLFGIPEAEIIGKTDYDFVPTEEADAFRANDLAAAAAGEPVTNEESLTRSNDGRRIWVQTTKTPMYSPDGKLIGVLGVARDISEIKQQQAILAAGNFTLEQVASGRPLSETLEHIVRNIERQSPEMICSILLLGADGRHLRHGSAPNLPNDYNRTIDGIEIGPSAGSCGTAAFTGHPVFVDDIEASPLWSHHKELAQQYDLRACWSTPILSGSGSVLGTFAVYYRMPRHADETDRQLIANAVHLAAIAIEKAQDEQRLNTQLEELRRWHSVTLNRETRILELKQEINELLVRLGDSPRYTVTLTEPKP